jgi:hypothetical protein
VTITDEQIQPIRRFFGGKRLAIFDEAVAVIRESVAQGGWVSRGAQRASKGLGKGIASHKALSKPTIDYGDPRSQALFRCYMAASYGTHLRQEELDVATDDDLRDLGPKVPIGVMRSWMGLMVALRAIFADLDASRTLPAVTEIGLSPKVTATLQDIGIDLDLSTRRMPPLDWRWVDAREIKDGRVVVILNPDGTPKQVKFYFVRWPDRTVFGSSRFSHRDCEACGKTIPSRMFVPVLIDNRAGMPHGFWVGCDCARNIFGIKDVGLPK